MHIIAVDDEYHALDLLNRAILKAVPGCDLRSFDNSADAIRYASGHPIDVAFLDVRIDELTGLQVAQRLKELHGSTNIIFVTGYDEYMRDALRMHVSGYLEKPVSEHDVADELRQLRNPIRMSNEGVRIRTFGFFEVYVNGKPIHFARSKSKELLAYLVDRKGMGVNRKELAAILWEDEIYSRQIQKQLQTMIDEMKRALRDAGAERIIYQEKGRFYLDVDRVDCDYYRFEHWDASAVNMFRGEYMTEYSWAEFTAGTLSQRVQK